MAAPAWKPVVSALDITDVPNKLGPQLGLVSSDDSYLTHGGGVSRAIWNASSQQSLNAWAATLPRPLALGSVVACNFGPLGTKWLFHAVTIDLDSRRRLRPADCNGLFLELESAVRVAVANMPSIPRSLAVPMIGTGAGWLPHRVVAEEIVSLSERLNDIGVRIIIASPQDAGRVTALIDELVPELVPPAPPTPPKTEPSLAPNPVQPQSPSGPGVSVGHSDKHVTKLATLLFKRPTTLRQSIEASLRELGYRGDLPLQLKEYCSRDCPIEILTRLGLYELQSIVSVEGLPPANAGEPIAALACRVLTDLGFHIPQPLTGLEVTIAETKKFQSQLVAAEPPQIATLVLSTSAMLERTIGDFIRFLCLHLYGHGPEVHFAGTFGKSGADAFTKATLGTRIEFLNLLSKAARIATGSNQQLDWRHKVLGGARLPDLILPTDLAELPQIRNSFAHGHAPTDAPSQRKLAVRFFSRTLELLSHWDCERDRIYPRIVRIERVSIDVWNRRTIETVDAQGVRQYLVTDRPVTPGSTYFMHPLTNPLRVDPILIEFEED